MVQRVSAQIAAPRVRWWICGLLFFATTINYVDRQVLGILKPVLSEKLGWNETEYGWMVFAFQLAYALMMPVVGRVLDWLGIRTGYLIAVVVWSFAAMAHAGARNALQFGFARFALGLGEAGNFPAAIKTTAAWFPQSERALATGIFNSGSNIGAIIAPLAVPWLYVRFGWQSAFIATGALGFVWVAAWLLTYRDRPPVEGVQPPKVEYASLLVNRSMWALIAGKFFTDPVWWFYLFWLPGYLNQQYHIDLTHLGLPLVVVYQASSFGSIGGGWLSAVFMKMGRTPIASRQAAMLICAIAVVPVMLVRYAGGNLWVAVWLVALAAAAHQGWSANLYTLASDVFPERAVGSVVGLAGFAGAVGGMLVAPAIGKWLDFSNRSYGPLFVVAGTAYLIALVIINILLKPRHVRLSA